MSVIDSFSSDSPAEQTPEAAATVKTMDYAQVFQALAVNQQVAETAFARCAKFHVKSLLGDVKYILLENAPEDLWVAGMQLSLRIDYAGITEPYKYPFEKESNRLRQLCVKFASSVLAEIEEGTRLQMVGALETSIKQVGVEYYSFILKQRWSCV